MCLNCHAKELTWGMAIFNLLFKVCCQVRQGYSFSLKTISLVEYTYVGETLTQVWVKSMHNE